MAVERTGGVYEHENTAFASAVVAALAAGLVFGVVLHEAGRMESIAAVYGLEGVTVGWLAHTVHSVFAGIFFLFVVTSLATIDSRVTRGGSIAFPIVTSLSGILYGLLLWGVVVALIVPIWGPVVGLERPFPYLHRPSLWGLGLFGGVLGLTYGILFESVTR